MSKRILIFNVNWLGDVLFSTPVIRAMRENYPDAYIACVIPGRCMPVLEGNPHLNEIIVFDEKDTHRSPFAHLKFVSTLRKRKFDTVFLLHRSMSRALLCRLAGIPERIGYFHKKRAFLLSNNIKPLQRDSLHRIDYYLGVIKGAGLVVKNRNPELWIHNKDKEIVDAFLQKHNFTQAVPLIVCNPGGNWLPKRWPLEHWISLIAALLQKTPCSVVITGSQQDKCLAQHITSKIQDARLIVSCGEFTLKQLAALSQRADVFISADSGPLHIACAAGAKVCVGLFGPTSTLITGPVPAENTIVLQGDSGCGIPCYEVNCQDNRCMKTIQPERVFEQVRKSLNLR